MIIIENIYHMLTYAFRTLNEDGFRGLDTEKFDNIFELYAAIIIKAISKQLKMGLDRDYIEIEETSSAIRGRIDLAESIKTNSFMDNKLVCSYDDYSENSYMNRIIKTTIYVLIGSDISRKYKKDLRRLLAYFSNVDSLDKKQINWRFNYNRNNQNYQLLMNICQAVIDGVLQTESEGSKKMMDFSDDQRMSRLYENFIYEYFKKEYAEIEVSAPYINWQLDDGYDSMLPRMMTDVVLSKDKKILIIDAKFWSSTTQTYYDSRTIHSNNLYQMFSYVKNKEEELKDLDYQVIGMLLYAETDQEIQPDESYKMSGNRIDVRTLNLNTKSKEIEKQLKEIAGIID